MRCHEGFWAFATETWTRGSYLKERDDCRTAVKDKEWVESKAGRTVRKAWKALTQKERAKYMDEASDPTWFWPDTLGVDTGLLDLRHKEVREAMRKAKNKAKGKAKGKNTQADDDDEDSEEDEDEGEASEDDIDGDDDEDEADDDDEEELAPAKPAKKGIKVPTPTFVGKGKKKLVRKKKDEDSAGESEVGKDAPPFKSTKKTAKTSAPPTVGKGDTQQVSSAVSTLSAAFTRRLATAKKLLYNSKSDFNCRVGPLEIELAKSQFGSVEQDKILEVFEEFVGKEGPKLKDDERKVLENFRPHVFKNPDNIMSAAGIACPHSHWASYATTRAGKDETPSVHVAVHQETKARERLREVAIELAVNQVLKAVLSGNAEYALAAVAGLVEELRDYAVDETLSAGFMYLPPAFQKMACAAARDVSKVFEYPLSQVRFKGLNTDVEFHKLEEVKLMKKFDKQMDVHQFGVSNLEQIMKKTGASYFGLRHPVVPMEIEGETLAPLPEAFAEHPTLVDIACNDSVNPLEGGDVGDNVDGDKIDDSTSEQRTDVDKEAGVSVGGGRNDDSRMEVDQGSSEMTVTASVPDVGKADARVWVGKRKAAQESDTDTNQGTKTKQSKVKKASAATTSAATTSAATTSAATTSAVMTDVSTTSPVARSDATTTSGAKGNSVTPTDATTTSAATDLTTSAESTAAATANAETTAGMATGAATTGVKVVRKGKLGKRTSEHMEVESVTSQKAKKAKKQKSRGMDAVEVGTDDKNETVDELNKSQTLDVEKKTKKAKKPKESISKHSKKQMKDAKDFKSHTKKTTKHKDDAKKKTDGNGKEDTHSLEALLKAAAHANAPDAERHDGATDAISAGPVVASGGHAEETVADVDEAQPAEAVDRDADEEEAEEAARRQEEADDAAARRAIVTIADTDESVAEETADLNAEKERDMNTVGQDEPSSRDQGGGDRVSPTGNEMETTEEGQSPREPTVAPPAQPLFPARRTRSRVLEEREFARSTAQQ